MFMLEEYSQSGHDYYVVTHNGFNLTGGANSGETSTKAANGYVQHSLT